MPELVLDLLSLPELEYLVLTKKWDVGGLANIGCCFAAGVGAPTGAVRELVSVTTVPAGASFDAASQSPDQPPKAGIGSGVATVSGTVVETGDGHGVGGGDGLGPPQV